MQLININAPAASKLHYNDDDKLPCAHTKKLNE